MFGSFAFGQTAFASLPFGTPPTPPPPVINTFTFSNFEGTFDVTVYYGAYDVANKELLL